MDRIQNLNVNQLNVVIHTRQILMENTNVHGVETASILIKIYDGTSEAPIL